MAGLTVLSLLKRPLILIPTCLFIATITCYLVPSLRYIADLFFILLLYYTALLAPFYGDKWLKIILNPFLSEQEISKAINLMTRFPVIPLSLLAGTWAVASHFMDPGGSLYISSFVLMILIGSYFCVYFTFMRPEYENRIYLLFVNLAKLPPSIAGVSLVLILLGSDESKEVAWLLFYGMLILGSGASLGLLAIAFALYKIRELRSDN